MPNIHQVCFILSSLLIVYKLISFFQVLLQSKKNSSQSMKGDVAPNKKSKTSTSKKQGNTSATNGMQYFLSKFLSLVYFR
jgi:hypothetical protein